MKVRKQVAAAAGVVAAVITTAMVVTPTPAETATKPIRLAAYYQWFPKTENWATRFTPTLGKYDSSNETILAAHVAQAKYAGLDAFISSWWGVGTETANRLPLLLDVAAKQNFKIAPYYEPASLSPTTARINADFDALAGKSTHPAWLAVDSKPVLFLYNTGSEATCTAVEKYNTAAAGRFYLNMKVFSGYRKCASQPDSWHQYGPAKAYDQQDKYAATVSPGFYKFNETTPRLARDVTRFRADLAKQIASGARWQLVTTFNEWGEGTAVEPAKEWQSASGMGDYLDAMREAYIGVPSGSPSTDVSPTESLSVSPTPTESSPTSATPTESSVSPTESSASPTETGSPPADPVIAAVGDVACAPGGAVGTGCQHKAVSDKIVADKQIDQVLALGDLQYESGTLAAFQQSYDPTFGRFKDKTKPVPGNHEYGTPDAVGYFDYFGELAGDPAKGYYSFDVGAWHFVALNSEKDISATGAQVAWLKADLDANKAKCVGAFWHKPRWSSGLHGDHTSMAVFVKPLYDAGADLILSGHDHSYERFAPLNPAGDRDDDKGIVQIVSGEGGKNHYDVDGRALTEAKDKSSYGYTRITLHPDSAGVEFVPAVGTFTDSAKINCH